MKQTQRVHFIWILVLVLGATLGYYFSAKATGTPSIAPFLILGIAGLLYYGVYLRLIINENGIRFRFTHLVKHAYTWQEIQEVQIIKYNPLLDFMGWGMRYSFSKKAWAYTIQGTDAMLLTLKSGKKVYVGIENPAGVSQYIATLKKNL